MVVLGLLLTGCEKNNKINWIDNEDNKVSKWYWLLFS